MDDKNHDFLDLGIPEAVCCRLYNRPACGHVRYLLCGVIITEQQSSIELWPGPPIECEI